MPSLPGKPPRSPSRSSRGRVDGRLVVLAVLGGAFLLWAIVFYTGLQQRERTRSGRMDGAAAGPARDSTAHPDSLRAWLAGLPREWVRVTRVEGQGFVIFVPCYTQAGTLALRLPPDSLPQVECEFCDSLGQYGVLGLLREGRDSAYALRLQPPAGDLRVLPVTDSLLKAYPEAPFRERLLLWARGRQQAGEPFTADTLVFVPKAQEAEFEVLRAEDENPEGCAPAAEGGGSSEVPERD